MVNDLFSITIFFLSTDLNEEISLSSGYRSGFEKIAKLLIDHGANVNAKERSNGLSPLHVAAENGDVQKTNAKNDQKN